MSRRKGRRRVDRLRHEIFLQTRSGLCSGDNEKRTISYLPTRDRREI